MFVPTWLLVLAFLLVVGLAAWSFLLAVGRNPHPFPDNGSRIFSASSAAAKDAVVALLAMHGVRERFQFNTGGVRRSIMWDGTIINQSSPEVLQKLGQHWAGGRRSCCERKQRGGLPAFAWVRGKRRP